MRKVGLFINSSAGGGAFQYCQTMLASVASLRQHQIQSIVYYTDPSWKKYVREYRVAGKHSNHWHFPGRKLLAPLLKRLPIGLQRVVLSNVNPAIKQMIAENCDIWIFPSRDDWMFLIDVPKLCVIHDLMHRERRFPECYANGEYQRRERISKNICKYSRGVIVNSESMRRLFCESYGYPLEKTHVLPYTAPPYIYNVRANKNVLKTPHLPKEYIFYPAQFWKHKNHENLLKAVSSLRRKIPNINLVLSGFKSKEFLRIRELAYTLGLKEKVFFLDYVDETDMVVLYERAKMLVMPTYQGPINIPPTEAFALGCPVATSNAFIIAGTKKNAALVFHPDSVRELASAIERIWTDAALRRDLIQVGKLWIKHWNQTHFSRRVWEILKSSM